MNIIEHAEGVYEIEEFLSHNSQDILLSLSGDEGWNQSHPGNIVKLITGDGNMAVKDILKDIKRLFIEFAEVMDIGNIRRLKNGEFMHLHKDTGSYDNRKPIVFGVAIYLNDDFTGGELVYPELNLTVNPRPRSMVIHKAEYLHEVLPVTSGSRYSITTFILGDESTRFIK
jgi:hypothetical protein